MLADSTTLRDLTVGNTGTGVHNAAVLARNGIRNVFVSDVRVQARGSGTTTYGIFGTDNATDLYLQTVYAVGENGTRDNHALHIRSGAHATVLGGEYVARGGNVAFAINILQGGALDADSVVAVGESAAVNNYGLQNGEGSASVVNGCSLFAEGGDNARGIHQFDNGVLYANEIVASGQGGLVKNIGIDNDAESTANLRGGTYFAIGGGSALGVNNVSTSTLDAESITAVGKDGSDTNYGLYNENDGTVTLRGGSFSASGGYNIAGIYNSDSGTTLEADSVTVLAENATNDNFCLFNREGASATLRGGSYTARGTTNDALGIVNAGNGTMLWAYQVTALGENGAANSGLGNEENAVAMLHGGSFIGRGGAMAHGINNSGATLEANSASVLGENDGSPSYGLRNRNGGAATLRGGSYSARGGDKAWGIWNVDVGTMLAAHNITADGQQGSSTNYGLSNEVSAIAELTQSVLDGATFSVIRAGGTVTVTNSRLIGLGASGAVSCVAVSRGAVFNTSVCP